VKAENAGGEAQCIADFVVLEPEPQAGTQTEQDLQMRTHVIFKDVREETIQVKLLTSRNLFFYLITIPHCYVPVSS
jgi:hypothetical protein